MAYGFLGFFTFWFLAGLFAGDDDYEDEETCPTVAITLTIVIVFCLSAVCVTLN